MTPLDYTVRERGRTLEIQLTKAPKPALREAFKEFGYRYNWKIHAWQGSIRHKDVLVDLCERAKLESARQIKRRSEGTTLCADCWHADKGCISDCSWARDFTPVEGWTADDRKILYRGEYTDSYHVKACPLFRKG